MRALYLLPILLVMVLPGCAHLDPLGSPKKQQRGADTLYEGDFPVTSGVICRELSGQTNIRNTTGTARGIRCMQVGDEDLPGCLRWGGEGAGYSYENSGCKK